MGMIEFGVAAKASEATDDEAVIEVPIDGEVFYARRPSTAQGVLMSSAINESPGAVFKLVEALLGKEGLAKIEQLIWERRIDFPDLIGGGTEQNPEMGLLDQIFEAFSERPTQPSTASSSSPGNGGRKSTGRSRGQGSIRS